MFSPSALHNEIRSSYVASGITLNAPGALQYYNIYFIERINRNFC